MKYIAIITIMYLWLTINPCAQPQDIGNGRQGQVVSEQSDSLKRLNKILEEQKPEKEPGALTQLDAQSVELLDEDTKAQYLSATREYYVYRVSGYQHRREVFRWQLYSSKVIFYVVIFLVLSGVYFSGIQFHRSLGGDARTVTRRMTEWLKPYQ